ncbi:unnamed protein product [Aspergillus oryzae]|uniref:DNA, SC111 n=3 Tax=Aspergillus oryzae TaxID=5062 RepID=Q2U855_ASPOR|nr:unnamed protein product [Aspergillus oryzae RIB40]GMF71832.1 unnamed protein product [Aspergillus oryzae]GMG43131.1 unnamed protein product [Aspergillus oryzae var. brunneus]BAE62260.1 unnamed protein product [Aspergillus oryzae RIB40]GMF85103.1 unnamed protein product [Aspergillus oryzae]GMG15184.1 unnamed protein product [Aspergillus oryzae]
MAVTTRSGLEHQAGNLDDTGLRIVGDYAIHRSPTEQPETQSPVQMTTVVGDVRREAQPSDFNPTLAPHPPVPYAVSNPEWWQQEYRRVPDYRPVNKDLDSEQRRQNRLFTAVGTFMIAGCSMIAVRGSLFLQLDISLLILIFLNRTGRHCGGTLLDDSQHAEIIPLAGNGDGDLVHCP